MANVLAVGQPWLKDEWSDERRHSRPSFANNTLAAAGDFMGLKRAIEYRRLQGGGGLAVVAARDGGMKGRREGRSNRKMLIGRTEEISGNK